jgi:choline dehydrogenase-like flavoprotein
MAEMSQFGRREFFVRAGAIGAAVVLFDGGTFTTAPAGAVLHVQSTMRMGVSASDSVLDQWGQSRWVQGLYVADNSALANSLGGSNPTVTTQALATRTAERIYSTVFGGEKYVGVSPPVVSTDDRITNAIASRL